MRCYVLALILATAFVPWMHIDAQVMLNTNYSQELKHATSLLADTTASDIPHHVHYDLKLYDKDGHASSATYDIYRDPILYTRVDIKADTFTYTRIESRNSHTSWLRYSGNKPLRIFDFEQVLDRPTAAIDRLSQELHQVQQMQPGQLQGTPLLCANDNAGTSICFQPLIHLFAYAQMFNQTVMYDQWLTIGTHTVPGSIRIYEDKKLLLEATGTVEAIKKFPPNLLQIPGTPSQADPAEAHKILRAKSIDMTQAVFGNIQVAVSVDEKGRVKKAEVIDSDDKKIEGMARKAARGIVFAPQMEDGQPVPFDTTLYLTYYPWW